MNKWITEDWEFIISVTSGKSGDCRLGFETGDTFQCQNENVAQKLVANIGIFTIDKFAIKCGAALNYITFLEDGRSCLSLA